MIKNEDFVYNPESAMQDGVIKKGYQPSASAPKHTDQAGNPKPPKFQSGVKKPNQ